MKFLASIGGVAIMFLLVCYRGLMLSTMWAWFVMTAFEDVPPISIATSIGLSLLVAAFVGVNKKKDDRSWGLTFVASFAHISVFFLLGWLVKQFL